MPNFIDCLSIGAQQERCHSLQLHLHSGTAVHKLPFTLEESDFIEGRKLLLQLCL